MQNNSQITEANLSLAELEALAEEIRLVIMGDKGLSLEQYIEIYNPQKEHAFTPEEDKFMRDHYEQGTAWLAKNLKRNIDSVFGRLKKLGIKAPVIHNGKNYKRFTLSDDVYMKVYAHKGAIWLSQFLNAHVKTIQNRARRKNIKLATQKEISRRETCQNNQTNTEKC